MNMEDKIGVTIIIEKENVNGVSVFIASSPEVNVIAEGKSVEEAKAKFVRGVKAHLETFPEEKELLVKSEEERYEMPMVSKVFL